VLKVRYVVKDFIEFTSLKVVLAALYQLSRKLTIGKPPHERWGGFAFLLGVTP
jgi:hypothetical protein